MTRANLGRRHVYWETGEFSNKIEMLDVFVLNLLSLPRPKDWEQRKFSIWQLAINVTIWLTPTALPWDLRLLGSMRQKKTRQTMFFVHSKYVICNFFSRRSNGLLPEHYPIWQIKCKHCIFFFKQANFHTTYNAINVCPIVICFILFNNMELTEKCGSTQTIAYSSWLSAIIVFFSVVYSSFFLCRSDIFMDYMTFAIWYLPV